MTEKTNPAIEARLVKKEDQGELKEIWKLCFGDEDEYLDLYFKNVDWIHETAVLLLNGRIVSMLTMIPVDLIGKDGAQRRASMLYAIATHPDFRKLGYADQLIEFSNRHLLSEQTAMTLLVPAREELFAFYEKRGYQNGFYIREADLDLDEIHRLAGLDSPDCRVVSAGPETYNSVRKKQLVGHSYLDYRNDEISFQKSLGFLFDANLFVIETDEGMEGCAYYERISPEQVIVKELLIGDRYAAAALKRIAELVPADRYIVRTPAHRGELLGGSVRPFGMIRNNRTVGKAAISDFSSDRIFPYLGIAYD